MADIIDQDDGVGRDLPGTPDDDFISGLGGDDNIDGGGGNDTILGGDDDDTINFDITADGADQVNGGEGDDTVIITGAVQQIRVTFTSGEVGNGVENDGGVPASNQDGGLAVRLQAEGANDTLTGLVSRYDDEGITFVGGLFSGIKFDVRDLPSGVARGDNFDVVGLGTSGSDVVDVSGQPFTLNFYGNAGGGADRLTAGAGNDFLVGGGGSDRLIGNDGDDSFIGGREVDVIQGGAGADRTIVDVSTDGADFANLGTGIDLVLARTSTGITNVRLSFVSGQVGNGRTIDSGLDPAEDGSLAVRFQAEDAFGELTGPVSRYDDEGVIFLSTTPGMTFDVRDLISGAQRGSLFEAVALGTAAGDTLDFTTRGLSYYVNGGAGADVLTGGALNDFLVGGSGADRLFGLAGTDSFIGGGGSDIVVGGDGDDVVRFNVNTGGADAVGLGVGDDLVIVEKEQLTNTAQVRLTFVSARVGNDSSVDAAGPAPQDGGLAVRFQAEDGQTDELIGSESRFDDEGVTFNSGVSGVTFDVRDLISGAERGNFFNVVTLGTGRSEVIDETGETRSYYINGGAGADTITGGLVDDFLVGGAGSDRLIGGEGDDRFIGGGGNDVIGGGAGDDRVVIEASVAGSGSDTVGLGQGDDRVVVSTTTDVTNVRLTFVSAQVGNGTSYDSGATPNEDGGVAVRFQVEDGAGNLVGPVSRYDDEGITFESATMGLTFDVRDLISGAQRGELFEVVTLGTGLSETIDETGETRSYYINAGRGADVVTGGLADDFLVGGAGDDTLAGGMGGDRYIGGGGADVINLDATAGVDIVIYAAVGDSTNGSLGRDTVNGFVAGSDRLSFAAIDANTTNAADMNDTFVFTAGGVFDPQAGAGQLISVDQLNGSFLVQGEIDGDGTADFAVLVFTDGGDPLTGVDFVL